MTDAIYDENILSDLHKDAYGYRPSESFWEAWQRMTVEEKNAEWEHLTSTLERSIREDKQRQDKNLVEWDIRIRGLEYHNKISRATAIRWDMDAMGANGDVSYYCYLCDISYDNEAPINKILEEEVQ